MNLKLVPIILLGVVSTTAVILFILNKNKLVIPNNPPSQICAKLANKQMQSNCLGIVNKDEQFCLKTADDGILACQAIVKNNPELCLKVTPAMQKKTCVNEVARINDNIISCEFADDKKDCVGSFLAGLYWDQKFNLMRQEYCEVFPKGDKDWCLALVTQNKSMCGKNTACLSLFIQPLSFCDNLQMSKSKGECLRDRAMTQRDATICELIDDDNDKNRCYFNIVGHINPDTDFCDKISDSEMKQECFTNAAVKLLLH